MGARPLRCRVLGHRWAFLRAGRTLRWSCERCRASGGERTYSTAGEAERLRRQLERGRPGPPTALLAAFGGTVERRRARRDS